ncbi:hypothetical protein GF420_10425 [candidate division GN15 bacterium]|nr:hypothetical protein [candidate division GN15 bacterium]
MRRAVVIALLGAIIIAGLACTRYVDSKDPVRSLPGAPPVPTAVTAEINSRSVSLSWAIENNASYDRFRIYMAPDTADGFTVKDSTDQTEITIDGLGLNRVYYFQVAAVDSSGLEGERSETVSAQTALLSITINNNAEYTSSRNVQVQLTANQAATHVYLSEDSTFADAIAQTFAAQRAFTLESGDGVKTVYARFVFFDGSQSGEPLADDIILDTRARVDSVWYAPLGVDAFSSGDTISFYLDAGEIDGEAQVSLAGVDPVVLNDAGADGDMIGADGIYSAEWVVPNDVTVNNGTVEGQFTDAAGNQASRIADSTLTIFSAPLPVQLTLVEALSSYEVSLNWSQAASADFASYRIYRATATDVSDSSELIATIGSRNTVNYVDTTVASETTYYYRVYVRNSLGLSAGSNTAGATTPVNNPPTAVVLAGALQDEVTVRLTWTQNADDDFQSYRIYRSNSSAVDEGDELVDIFTSRSNTSATFALTTNRWYRVFVYDRQGLSTASNAIQITN